MKRIEKSPATNPDGRRTTYLDLVRTGVWYSVLIKMAESESPGKICDLVEGGYDLKNKWVAYSKMKSLPNNLTLERAERKFPGSLQTFESGPNNLKLWVALESDDDSILEIISKVSSDADGLIARLKLDIKKDKVSVMIRGNSNMENDPFVRRVHEISLRLCEHVSPTLAQAIADRFLFPLADHLYENEEESLYEFILEGRGGNTDRESIINKESYLEMKASLKGNKGAGGGPKGK